VISSTPDGTGPIAVDNFITINGQNVCAGLGSPAGPESCFGPITNPGLPTGVPIEAVLQPVPPVNVSQFIPTGTTAVLFELRDFGVIAGNTDLFLVTTAQVIPPEPPLAATGLDTALELFRGELKPALVEAFQRAFNTQVITPIIKGLREAGADPNTIDKVKKQLIQARAEQASTAANSVASLFEGQTIVSKFQRNVDKRWLQELPTLPTSIERFVPKVGEPTITINQSVNDILASGFDPNKVEYTWQNISAEAVLPGAVIAAGSPAASPTGTTSPGRSPTIKGTGKCEVKVSSDGTRSEKCEGGPEVKTDDTTVSGKVSEEVKVNPNGTSVETVGVSVEVPDLSGAGIVVLLATAIVLGAFRHKPVGPRMR